MVNVAKYTVRHMDPMGKKPAARSLSISEVYTWKCSQKTHMESDSERMKTLNPTVTQFISNSKTWHDMTG